VKRPCHSSRGGLGKVFPSLKRFAFERTQDGCHSLSSVIAGLDPAIHLLRKTRLAKLMDPRVTPENG
jgi:hypothetical protein